MRRTKERINGVVASQAVGPKILGQLNAEDTAYLRKLIVDVQNAQAAVQAFANYQQMRHGIPLGWVLNDDGVFTAAPVTEVQKTS